MARVTIPTIHTSTSGQHLIGVHFIDKARGIDTYPPVAKLGDAYTWAKHCNFIISNSDVSEGVASFVIERVSTLKTGVQPGVILTGAGFAEFYYGDVIRATATPAEGYEIASYKWIGTAETEGAETTVADEFLGLTITARAK